MIISLRWDRVCSFFTCSIKYLWSP